MCHQSQKVIQTLIYYLVEVSPITLINTSISKFFIMKFVVILAFAFFNYYFMGSTIQSWVQDVRVNYVFVGKSKSKCIFYAFES